MGFLSGILDIGKDIIGGAIGGLFGYEGQKDTNEQNLAIARETNAFNAAEAEKNRSYQTTMSGTAYQRAMADMKMAGLNPMLAASQGGASTPSGSSASGIAARMGNANAAALEGAALAKRVANETKLADSQAALNQANATKAAAETVTSEATAKNVDASTDKIRQEIPRVKADTDLAIENAARARSEAMNADARTALAKVETVLKQYQTLLTEVEIDFRKGAITYQDAQTALARAQTSVSALQSMIMRPEALKSDTWFGEAVPYLRDLTSVIPKIGGR